MKVLLIASLALAPLAGFASLGVDPQSDAQKAWPAGHDGLGHEPAPRQSAQSFGLELTALGLGPLGALDASGADCVVLRAQGGARVLSGHARLEPVDDLGPARLRLEALAPRVGRDGVDGLAPLRMELRAFDLANRDDAAYVGVELAEGAFAAAVGKRVTLTLAIEHVGAPIMMAVASCGS